jgi:hypothetical protein
VKQSYGRNWERTRTGPGADAWRERRTCGGEEKKVDLVFVSTSFFLGV